MSKMEEVANKLTKILERLKKQGHTTISKNLLKYYAGTWRSEQINPVIEYLVFSEILKPIDKNVYEIVIGDENE